LEFSVASTNADGYQNDSKAHKEYHSGNLFNISYASTVHHILGNM